MNPAIELRRLYIVRTLFSSENQRASTEEIDDMSEKVTFRWAPERRKAIATVRNTYRHQITAPCLNFYGLFVIKDKDREAVSQIAEKADQDMKKVDPELSARVTFLPLYVEESSVGEVYTQVLGAIQGRIYTELLSRLRELAKLPEVPKQSRTALLRLCDKLAAWNVLEDPSVTKTLADIKLQISNDIFAPVMADLEKDLADLKSRGAYLEFDDAPPAPAPIAPVIQTTPVVTTEEYWDCECKTDYIHAAEIAICPVCGSMQEDQPNSRVNEIEAAGLKLKKVA